MNDPKVSNPHLELFFDKVQEKFPVTASDGAREALRYVFTETTRAEHNATAMEIFDNMKMLLTNDIETWKNQVFSPTFIEMFQKDLRAGLLQLLTFIYTEILENIALSGGLQIVTPAKALGPIPNHIEVVDADDLTEKEKAMLDRAPKGQA